MRLFDSATAQQRTDDHDDRSFGPIEISVPRRERLRVGRALVGAGFPPLAESVVAEGVVDMTGEGAAMVVLLDALLSARSTRKIGVRLAKALGSWRGPQGQADLHRARRTMPALFMPGSVVEFKLSTATMGVPLWMHREQVIPPGAGCRTIRPGDLGLVLKLHERHEFREVDDDGPARVSPNLSGYLVMPETEAIPGMSLEQLSQLVLWDEPWRAAYIRLPEAASFLKKTSQGFNYFGFETPATAHLRTWRANKTASVRLWEEGHIDGGRFVADAAPEPTTVEQILSVNESMSRAERRRLKQLKPGRSMVLLGFVGSAFRVTAPA